MMIAMVKPTEIPMPFTTLWIKLYDFCTLVRATPSTAQLVVIRGRYTPRASYSDGMDFLRNISTN